MNSYIPKHHFGFLPCMKVLLLSFFMLCVSLVTYGQKPKNGTYTYSITFAERQLKSSGASCTVIIKGDSKKVLHNGKGILPGKKGDILDQGIILKHTRTGKWIIGHTAKDKDLQIVGGCSGGPSEIDFKRRRYLSC